MGPLGEQRSTRALSKPVAALWRREPTPRVLAGRNGEANDPDLVSLFETAALQGYHVIALTYPNQGEDRMRDPGNLSHYCGAPDHCFGQFMQEVIDGTQCPPALCNDDDGHDDLRFETGRHPQDTIVRRLEAALTWAVVMHPFDGWAQFRNTSGSVRWGRVTVAGHSLGSSYAAMLGVQFPVHRVALFSGPDDQINGDPDPWIQPTSKEDRFFGLAHISDDSVETSEAWTTFGMDGFSYLYPPPNTVTNFGNAQMLISMDIGDNHPHTAVVKTPFSGNTRIDYRPAWRHLFGSGYIGF